MKKANKKQKIQRYTCIIPKREYSEIKPVNDFGQDVDAIKMHYKEYGLRLLITCRCCGQAVLNDEIYYLIRLEAINGLSGSIPTELHTLCKDCTEHHTVKQALLNGYTLKSEKKNIDKKLDS